MLCEFPVDHICFALRDVRDAMTFSPDSQFEELVSQGVLVTIIPNQRTDIELIVPTSNESVLRFVNSRQTPAFHHLCFGIDSFLLFKSSQRIEYIYSAPQPGFKNKLVNFFKLGSTLFEVAKSLNNIVYKKKVIVSEDPVHEDDAIWVLPKWIEQSEREFNTSLDRAMVPFKEWNYPKDKITEFFRSLQAEQVEFR